MNIQEIINNIAAGDNVAAKQSIEDAISEKTFDALQSRKQEIASTLFGGQEQDAEEAAEEELVHEEDVELDGEQLDEISLGTAEKAYTQRYKNAKDEDDDSPAMKKFDRSQDVVRKRFGTAGKKMMNQVDRTHKDNY